MFAGFIPYQVDVPMYRWPIANWAIMGLTWIVSLAVLFSANPNDAVQPFVLDGWKLGGLFGHVLVHAGFIHLIGNMIFLWVFGNAICAKVGNGRFLIIYILLGLFAAATHNVCVGRRAIGASGAINGLIGMFLVWYPLNDISCCYLFWLLYIVRVATFRLSSYWMILLWFVYDILGAAFGTGRTGYWAHISGFVAGFALAWILLAGKWVEMTPTERSLREIFLGRRRPTPSA